MLRAYAQYELKSLNEDQRSITGVASTPNPDRMGDVIESLGITFAKNLKLLLYHDTKKPVGHVQFDRPTKDGLRFTAKLADVREPGVVRERIEEAWHSLKAGLLSFVSIGFRPLGYDDDSIEWMENGGIRYKQTEVLELSLVTIPANAEAVIDSVKSMNPAMQLAVAKSFDAAHLAASGLERSERPTPPAGASAASRVISVRKGTVSMNVSERITEYENKRAAEDARRVAIQTKVTEEGRTKDQTEREEFDNLSASIAAIDAELVDLRAMEGTMKKGAVPVDGKTPQAAAASRSGVPVIEVKSNLPKGTAFVRYAMAIAAGKGSLQQSLDMARHRWEKTTPEVVQVLKAAVEAGTTTDATWAAPLVIYQNMASELIEMLRPSTIIGRIQGFHRVPFNVSMPRQNTGSTVNWVGQGVAKPVGELSFDTVSLGISKAAGIVVLAEELVRSSSPSAEEAVRRDLTAAITEFLDAQFIDPSVAAVTNVSPASVTNGSTVVDSTGTNLAAFNTDLGTALAVFTAADLGLGGITIVMTETQAVRLAMILNAFGQPQFPNITASGGSIYGYPVVTSENIPAEGGSPAGNRIVLLKAGEILMADDGGVVIDSSREASVQMNTTPDNPATASTVLISLWQNNLVGIKVERFINWLKRRSAASVVIEGAVYTG